MNDINEQFSSIYDEYIEKIYRFVYLKVNSEEIAQDITSKVFMKGWESFKNKTDIANIGAFLYQIARNAVIDHYREKARSKVVPQDSVAELADLGTNLQDKAILNADIAIVKTAISKIKDDYQDIIIWHYLEDRPIADIAKTLDKPEGTVRVMLHRGLKDLKDIINES